MVKIVAETCGGGVSVVETATDCAGDMGLFELAGALSVKEPGPRLDIGGGFVAVDLARHQ